MSEQIGQWFARVYKNSRFNITKFHKIESVIEDRFVTKCGRQMRRTDLPNWEDLEFRTDMPSSYYNTCSQCW